VADLDLCGASRYKITFKCAGHASSG